MTVLSLSFVGETFAPEETLDLDRASPILYMGNDLYVTTSGETVRSLAYKVYGER